MIELIKRLKLDNTTHNNGTDKYSIHRYIQDFYADAFEEYRHKSIAYKPIKLLEIGTHTGASLWLWQCYFGPYGTIVGIDIEDTVFYKYFSKDISYLVGDAYKNEGVVKYLNKFDIIIDDGPHTLESWEKFIDIYFDKLNAGGLFVIEDIDSLENFALCQERLQEKTNNKIHMIDNSRLGDKIIDGVPYSNSIYKNSRLLWVKK